MRFSSRLLVFLGLWYAAAVHAADVHQCTGAAGEPLFSQRPCTESGSSSVILPGPRVSAGQGLRVSEIDWLARRERERARAGTRSARPGYRPAAPKATKNDCARRRMALEDINARLRRGYKPAQGERLKQRRRQIENYIDTVCSR